MSHHEDVKNADGKLHNSRSGPAAHDIREGIADLAHDIGAMSAGKAHAAADYMHDRFDDATSSGKDALARVDKYIRVKPAQSVAIAFTAGLLASYLLGRRSS